MKNLRVIACVAAALCQFTFWDAQSLAQGGRKPERQDLPATSTSKEQSDALYKAWRDQKRPGMSLFVGYVEKGQPVFRGTPVESQLTAAIRGQMIEAGLSDAIVLPTQESLREARQQLAVEGNRTADSAADIAKIMSRQNSATRIAIVVLLQSNGSGDASVSLEIHDLRDARMMGSKQFIGISERDPQLEEVRKFSTAIVVELAESLSRDARALKDGRPIQLRLFGMRDNEQADDIAELLAGVQGVSDVSIQSDRQGKTSFAVYQLFYPEEPRRLVRQLRLALLEDGLSLRQLTSDEGSVLAELLSVTRPAWCLLTDEADPSFESSKSARERGLRNAGSPRLAIVVGTDLKSPVAEFTNPEYQPLTGQSAFQNAELTGQLADWFTRLGFDVRDSAPIRQRISDRVRTAERFADASDVVNTLRDDVRDFDCLVYVSLSPDFRGPGYRYSAQLVSWADGAIVGAQRWPDPGFEQLENCPLDVRDPRDVARYLAGNLAERWDKFAKRRQSGRTLQVLVKGLSDAAALGQVADVFRSIPSVREDGIDRFLVSGSVGGFDVVFSGRPGDVVDAFRKNRERLTFPIAIEAQSEFELVLNLQERTPRDSSRGSDGATGQSADPAGLTTDDILKRAPKQVDNFHALIVGVNYKGDAAKISPLNFCVADAKLMRDILVKRCGYPEERVVLMTDDLPENSELFPNAMNIERQVDALSRRIRAGDKVLFHFSGHGSTVTDAKNTAVIDEPVLVARSIQGKGPFSLSIRSVRDALRRAQANEVVLIVDACHSGGIGGGLGASNAEGAGPADQLLQKFIDAIAVNNQSTVTLAGSRLNQFSLEDPRIGHGFFTYYLTEGLSGKADTESGNRDGKVTFDELYRFTYDGVSKATQGNQQPFMSAAVIDSVVLADFSK